MVKTIPNSYPQVARFPVTTSLEALKAASLEWAAPFDPVSYLDSNQSTNDRYGKYEALLAVGAESILQLEHTTNAFGQLKSWYDEDPAWIFGFLSYDLKNDTEKISSDNPDHLGFPVMHFFRPIYLIEFHQQEVVIHSQHESPEVIYGQILAQDPKEKEEVLNQAFDQPNIQAKISKEEYLKSVEAIRAHIQAGDLYEMNFCQEFFALDYQVDPFALFKKLNIGSAAPFSAWYKQKNQFLMAASPERFIQKTGSTLISQPIKGTIRRGVNATEDLFLQNQLFYSEKDRAENIMIVDLVRNDLAKSCQAGTIKVEELFGIYTFQQVFQMISTISGTLRPEVHFIDAIKHAFPMGSMTGAPKVISMELIEDYEQSRRGLYAGAVGYITPSGDFDFNVVIRSLQYNSESKYLSYQVGGAIVYDSDPISEYEECLLKTQGILKALGIQESTSGLNPNRLKSSQKAG